MSKLPKISINIPLITGGDPSSVLESIKNSDYPKKLVEIVIVEGNQIATQRNLAMKNSTGSLLYLLDDDSHIQKNSFKLLASEFSDPKVAAVGGPSLTDKVGGTYFNELVALTLETYFGAMRMRFRYSNQHSGKGTEFRLIGANLGLRKSAVAKVGSFNERIVPNEETELLRRLTSHGYKLKYVNKLFIFRNHRRNFYHLGRQFFHYGKGRARQIMHSFNLSDIIFFIPVFFAIYIVLLFSIRNPYYLIPLLIYFSLGLATSLKAAVKHKKPDLILSMTATFPAIHLSYGLGLIRGFLTPFLPKKVTKNYKFKVTKFTFDKNNVLKQK